MTPADAVALLRADIDYLQNNREPLSVEAQRALCVRLAMVAEALTGLQPLQPTDTLDDMHSLLRNEVSASRLARTTPELDAVIDTGWSILKLSKALSANPKEFKISNTQLMNILRGEKGELTPDLKRRIRKITGAKL